MKSRLLISALLLVLLIGGCSSKSSEPEPLTEEVKAEAIEEQPVEPEDKQAETDQEADVSKAEEQGRVINEIKEEPKQTVSVQEVQTAEAKPVKKAPAPKEQSYLMDKTKEYVMEFEMDGQLVRSINNYVGPEQMGEAVWDLWESQLNGETSRVAFLENKEGLILGFPESESYQELEYPIGQGKKFSDGWDRFYTITAIGQTVTTPAGTFHDAIEVTSDEGRVSYYAPNVGFVKAVEHGKVVSQVVELNTRK